MKPLYRPIPVIKEITTCFVWLNLPQEINVCVCVCMWNYLQTKKKLERKHIAFNKGHVHKENVTPHPHISLPDGRTTT